MTDCLPRIRVMFAEGVSRMEDGEDENRDEKRASTWGKGLPLLDWSTGLVTLLAAKISVDTGLSPLWGHPPANTRLRTR